MPRKKFVRATFSYNEESDDDFCLLTCTGQMNSNIIQLKKILDYMMISNQFISPEYGMPFQENSNEFFHLLKGVLRNKIFIILCTTPGLMIKFQDMTKITKIMKDQENVDLLFAISSVGIKSDALKFCEENQITYLKLEKNGFMNILEFINKFIN
ncbi:uncharacterized protein OCT59_019497 [Rhizophagus irregularis]|uniref:uncharacterized protein n=1 Tax=Rhizophagus irregularis TaxID=588596 RepID=UPI001A009853|nr:hypothetical protein OCT59_019497 [Rhizophagus irregularis]GET56058.1 hypothetical protein RIR_jg26161.t1 [Rhizophagus irregularis DAOM 181602=DAOM 197198]